MQHITLELVSILHEKILHTKSYTNPMQHVGQIVGACEVEAHCRQLLSTPAVQSSGPAPGIPSRGRFARLSVDKSHMKSPHQHHPLHILLLLVNSIPRLSCSICDDLYNGHTLLYKGL